MTTIADMDLPDEVVEAVGARISKGVEIWGDGEVNISWELAASVVRAALQAMCDCGMAEIHCGTSWKSDDPSN